MIKNVSRLIKKCAYIFFVFNILKEGHSIALEMSYLNTGRLMGTESMVLMLWSLFVSYVISLVIYSLGIIIEYYENSVNKIN